jgi:hypothetical protein
VERPPAARIMRINRESPDRSLLGPGIFLVL